MFLTLIRSISQLPTIVLIMVLFLLTACESQVSVPNANKAKITISIGATPHGSHSLSRALPDEIPQSVTSIFIRVWRAGQLLADADILSEGGKVTLSIPAGVNLTVTGTAYADQEIVFQGETELEPLLPGESANVPLHLTAFGPGATGASQIDIIGGISGNGKSDSALFFSGNDFVLFYSSSDNLAQDNDNYINNLFVKEIANDDKILNVHTNSAGKSGNGTVGVAGINATGEYVVFSSDADNLLEDETDTNAVRDVFLKVLDTNKTTRISEATGAIQAIQKSIEPSISDDGVHIVFVSEEALLLDGRVGIFWFDRVQNKLEYVGPGRRPIISGNGEYVVAWEDISKQLVRYQLKNEVTSIVLVSSYDILIPTGRTPYAIDQAGQKITYALQRALNDEEKTNPNKAISELADNDIASDIYLYDFTLLSERTRLLSLSQDGLPVEALFNSVNPALSAEAQFIVFSNGNTIYVKSTSNNTLTRLAVRGRLPSLSRDGQKIAFTAENDKLYSVNNPLFEQKDDELLNPVNTLNITLSGNGNGFVTSEGGNINCGENCDFDYQQGTLIQLTATADEDTIFSGWNGVCEIFGNTTTIPLSVNTNTDCSAEFTATRFDLVLTIEGGTGGGYVISNDELQTIKPDDCEATPGNTVVCNAKYPAGETITLLPTINGNSDGIRWDGCDEDNGLDGCVITLEEPRNIFATFGVSDFNLAVDKTGNGIGSITSEDASINCGDICNHDYANQTNILLTAQADDTSLFVGWAGEAVTCTGTKSTITITMDSAHQCSANFTLKDKTLSITLDGTGIGVVSSDPAGLNCGTDCEHTYAHGSLITLTAAPEDNSKFVAWGGSCSGSDATVSVTTDAAKTCSAKFDVIQIGLSIKLLGSGTGQITSDPLGINCPTDCGQAYDIGTVIKLTAVAANDSQFVGWNEACSGNVAVTSVTIDKAKQCEAIFDIRQPQLTIVKSGTGSGMVTSDIAGIECDNDCIENYDFGTQVTLTAEESINSNFIGWSGACNSDSAIAIVTVDEAKSCEAKFDIKRLPLTVIKTGTGAGNVISEPGIICGDDCTENYNFGTQVTLTANPANSSDFTGWSGACSGDSNITTVTMDAAKSCQAQFSLKILELTITKSGNKGGTVSSNPTGITCGTNCAKNYQFGTEVTLSVTADDNSNFAGWSGDCSGSSNSTSVIMSSAKKCNAKFTLKQFKLTVGVTGKGSVTSDPTGINCGDDCSENYNFGKQVTLTAAAANDSNFAGWGGACSSKTNTATVTMDQAKSCDAKFTLKQFKLTVAITGKGSVTSDPTGINCSGDCIENYNIGKQVTLTAAAADDSNFAGWGGACSSKTNTTTVTMDQAKSCDAKFTLKQFKLTVGVTGNGTVTSNPVGINCGADCEQNYNIDTSVTLTAIAAKGSIFRSWNGACISKSNIATITMGSNQNCEARFELQELHTITNIRYSPSSPATLNTGDKITITFDYETTATNAYVSVFHNNYNLEEWASTTSSGWQSASQGSGTITATYSIAELQAGFSGSRLPELRFRMSTNIRDLFNNIVVDSIQKVDFTFVNNIVSQGQLEIPQTWLVNLETAAVDASGDDFWFQAATATERYITPINYTLLARMGISKPSKTTCEGAKLSSAQIAINDKSNGDYFCIQTDEGHIGRFQIISPIGPSPGTLVIDYIVWAN